MQRTRRQRSGWQSRIRRERPRAAVAIGAPRGRRCVVGLRCAMPDVPDRWPLPDKFPETRLMPRPATVRGKINAVLGIAKIAQEQLHKIGGEPDWIQDDETPQCCGQPASFYGQLGSLAGKHDL